MIEAVQFFEGRRWCSYHPLPRSPCTAPGLPLLVHPPTPQLLWVRGFGVRFTESCGSLLPLPLQVELSA